MAPHSSEISIARIIGPMNAIAVSTVKFDQADSVSAQSLTLAAKLRIRPYKPKQSLTDYSGFTAFAVPQSEPGFTRFG
jgi:hypothetical protein